MSTLASALQAGTLACAFLALVLFTYAVTSAPSRLPQHLGLRGWKRMQALRENELFAQLEPLMRWLSTRISGLLSPRLRAHLDEQIVLAGDALGLEPEDCVSLSLLCSLGGVLLGIGYAGPTQGGAFFALIAGGIGLFLPYLQLMSAAQRRLRRIQVALPNVVDLLALSLGAGLDFPAALRQIVDRASRQNEPLIEELGLVLQELNLGRTRREAIEKFAARAPCESVRELCSAVVQGEEQGTPLASVLKTQASSSRARRSVLAEETAARAGAALMLPLALLFVCILLLIMAPIMLQLGPQLAQ